jgi:hypothetical protein
MANKHSFSPEEWTKVLESGTWDFGGAEGASSPLINKGFFWKPTLKGPLTPKGLLDQWKPEAPPISCRT